MYPMCEFEHDLYTHIYAHCNTVSLVGLEGGGNTRLGHFAHYLCSILT